MTCLALFAFLAMAPTNLLRDASWTLWAPRPEIAAEGRKTADALILQSERFEQYGKWQATVPASAGRYYRLSGRYRAEKITDETSSVAMLLTWWKTADGSGQLQRDYIDNYERKGQWTELMRTVQAPAGATAVTVDLVLRWAAGGRVSFSGLDLSEVPAPAPRLVRLATTRITPGPGATLESNRELINRMAERVGEAKPDIVLFTENLPDRGVPGTLAERSEPIPGPTTEVLSRWARHHKSYMVITLHEVENGLLYNTAVLIDREGRIAGKYRKVHLTISEAEKGITPGRDFPVFQTDVGKIGIMTCWDNWFVESARTLRLKGAEIILFPLAGDEVPGHFDPVTRARALENGVYLVSSVTGGSSTSRILNPAGELLAEVTGPFDFAVRQVDLNQQWRVKYLSVNPGTGEGRVLYIKERRPEAYAGY